MGVTVVELAKAHVNNVASNLKQLVERRNALDVEIAQVEHFLNEAKVAVQQEEIVGSEVGANGQTKTN